MTEYGCHGAKGMFVPRRPVIENTYGAHDTRMQVGWGTVGTGRFMPPLQGSIVCSSRHQACGLGFRRSRLQRYGLSSFMSNGLFRARQCTVNWLA